MRRDTLQRESRGIETPMGTVRFKVATRGGRVLNAAPEFDDCARIAAERGIPIKEVQAVAMRAWLETVTGSGVRAAGSGMRGPESDR